jgi:transcription initiation factor TFIID subunit 13
MSTNEKADKPEKKDKISFTKELYPLIYAFGDVPTPRPDTVALVEQLTIDYLTNFLEKSKKLTSNNKPRVEEMLFVIRNDDKKLSRVEGLLYMNEELKKARKAFDVDDTDT